MPSVAELQKFFQRGGHYTHMLGKTDRITSVLVPATLATVAAGLLVRGLHNLYTGESALSSCLNPPTLRCLCNQTCNPKAGVMRLGCAGQGRRDQ